MKKALILICILLALPLSGGCTRRVGVPPVPTPAAAERSAAPTPEVQALMERNREVWAEKQRRPWMAGRLLIPAANIDVALFIWGPGDNDEAIRQGVTDAEDSAMLYSDGVGNIIADHNNQGFLTLHGVQPGDRAYILAGDCVLTLVCDLVTDGINTGRGITDTEGNWVSADEDFVCYTCGEDWTQIRIVGLMEIDEDFFDMDPVTPTPTQAGTS